MTKQKITLIIILVLFLGCIFFGFKYFSLQKELRKAQATLETQKTNEKVLEFTKLFIEKVLKAETEVDFKTRLKLETSVRDLEDQEILNQWQKFVNSQTENEAQNNVKDLLEVLVTKIKVK